MIGIPPVPARPCVIPADISPIMPTAVNIDLPAILAAFPALLPVALTFFDTHPFLLFGLFKVSVLAPLALAMGLLAMAPGLFLEPGEAR